MILSSLDRGRLALRRGSRDVFSFSRARRSPVLLPSFERWRHRPDLRNAPPSAAQCVGSRQDRCDFLLQRRFSNPLCTLPCSTIASPYVSVKTPVSRIVRYGTCRSIPTENYPCRLVGLARD